MGNKSTKSSLKSAFAYLTISAKSVSVSDTEFWNQIFLEDLIVSEEIINSISTREVRMLRDGSPQNFATLAYKMIEKLYLTTGTLCNTHNQQKTVLNAARILTRIIPCIFEDTRWRLFFFENILKLDQDRKASVPETSINLMYPDTNSQESRDYKLYLPCGSYDTMSSTTMGNKQNRSSISKRLSIKPLMPIQNPFCSSFGYDATKSLKKEIKNKDLSNFPSDSLAKYLITALCDLLFCPEFTVLSKSICPVDSPPDDIRAIDACEYVWEAGVGFDLKSNSTTYYDKNRSELIKLLLTCLSNTLYLTPSEASILNDKWLNLFVTNCNRNALPIFTSLLNTIFIYQPSKLLLFQNLIFSEAREKLVGLSLQLLLVTLDYDNNNSDSGKTFIDHKESTLPTNNDKQTNLFVEYLSRIHRQSDFMFIIKGMSRLLRNHSKSGLFTNTGKSEFEQELLLFLWRICNINKKFICLLLKTQDILDIVTPILLHLNENFHDPTKTAFVHVDVFNLLILSGQRNFGVRLNKPYQANLTADLPPISGSYADLFVIVFHKMIYFGQAHLFRLFDYLLSILANISPYIKALSLYSSQCLVQLFEIFSSSTVIFTNPRYHQPVIFLLEIFNNIVQYQFDGNANLICAIAEKRQIFYNLAKLPTSKSGIQNVLSILAEAKKQRDVVNSQIDRDNKFVEKKLDDDYNNHVDHIDFSINLDATLCVDRRKVSDVDESKNSLQVTKQKVSLVATPEFEDITSPVNLMDEKGSQNQEVIKKGLSSAKASNHENLGADNGNASNDIFNFEYKDKELFLNSVDDKHNLSTKDIIADSSPIDTCPLGSNTNQQADLKKSVKWIPDPDWVKQYKSSLPLQTILRMLDVLEPQLSRFSKNSGANASESINRSELIKFIQNGTLVGLLPVPHAIFIRKYHTNAETTLWFRTCTWGLIYIRNNVWTDTLVELVTLKTQ